MKVIMFEQSGCIIETQSGSRLAIDIGNKTPLEKLTGISADAMLISHIHGDHFSLEQIKTINPAQLYLNRECKETLGEETLSFEVKEIKVGDTVTMGDCTVQCFNVDHGPNVSAPLLENFGFLISADGEILYFSGDMYYPSGIDVILLEVDYALIPVGTHYTFGPEEAFVFAKQFKSIKTLIPMHYANKPETLGQFNAIAKETFSLK